MRPHLSPLSRRAGGITLVALAAAFMVACGGRGTAADDETRSPSPAPTPSTTVVVVPSVGASDAVYSIEARGFTPGETLRFEILRPDGTTFRGSEHTVSAAGTVNTTYRPTAAGEYTVRAVGISGAESQTRFVATGGESPAPSPAASSE